VAVPRAAPNRAKLSPLAVAKLRPKARTFLIWDTVQRGVERNATVSRERELSDTEVPLFWEAFSEAGLPGMAFKRFKRTNYPQGGCCRRPTFFGG
jgi:hypothetical protein